MTSTHSEKNPNAFLADWVDPSILGQATKEESASCSMEAIRYYSLPAFFVLVADFVIA